MMGYLGEYENCIIFYFGLNLDFLYMGIEASYDLSAREVGIVSKFESGDSSLDEY